MHNFNYYVPTDIFFGKGQISQLPAQIKKYGSSVLLVYGGGSIKKTGIYDTIVNQMKENGIPFQELSGVEPNPRIQSVYAGVKLCREHGIDITHSRSVSGASTSTYMFITDENGDMQLAVSDMEIYSYLTPEYMASKLDVINNASLCVIDTNLPEETIRYLCENCTVPIFADPVSTAKAVKLLPVLGKIHTIKPNMLEAALLTGIPVTDERSARKAVDILLELGVKQVFLSMGSAGVLYGNARGKKRIPNYPAEVRNTTGAGDSFMAALVMAYLSEFSTEKAARCGLAAAAICIEGENTINETLSII